nr:alpha/beta hydrolase [Candidatus Sigynarchaeum springense]
MTNLEGDDAAVEQHLAATAPLAWIRAIPLYASVVTWWKTAALASWMKNGHRFSRPITFSAPCADQRVIAWVITIQQKGSFAHGIFLGKIPYAKSGTGPKKAVIFPGSMDLILSLALDPRKAVKQYEASFPPDYTFYILGYDRNLPASTTLDSITQDFGTIIEKEVGKATIIGRSYGGFVALRFAHLFPHLVERVVLLSSAWGLSDTGKVFAKNLSDALEKEDFSKAIDELAGLFTSKAWRILVRVAMAFMKRKIIKTRNPGSTLVNAYAALLNSPIEPEKLLPGIKAPTIIIGGTRDKVFSEAIYRQTASLIPGCKLHLFEGAGHMMETVGEKKVLSTLLPYL